MNGSTGKPESYLVPLKEIATTDVLAPVIEIDAPDDPNSVLSLVVVTEMLNYSSHDKGPRGTDRPLENDIFWDRNIIFPSPIQFDDNGSAFINTTCGVGIVYNLEWHRVSARNIRSSFNRKTTSVPL